MFQCIKLVYFFVCSDIKSNTDEEYIKKLFAMNCLTQKGNKFGMIPFLSLYVTAIGYALVQRTLDNRL